MSFFGYVVKEVLKKKRGQLLISWCLFMISSTSNTVISFFYSENILINVQVLQKKLNMEDFNQHLQDILRKITFERSAKQHSQRKNNYTQYY